MKYTIKSRKLDKTITFSRPKGGYIYVDLNGQSGTLGYQICRGGGLLGDTLSYDGDDEDRFMRICNNWYRAYLRDRELMGF